MPNTFTTTQPEPQQPSLGNGVENEIAVDWPDYSNYGEYRVEFCETGASEWKVALSNRTVLSTVDSLSSWSAGGNASIELVDSPTEEGSSVRVDATSGSGADYDTGAWLDLSGVDLSGDDYLQLWVHNGSGSANYQAYLNDENGGGYFGSVPTSVPAGEGELVQIPLQQYRENGVDLSAPSSVKLALDTSLDGSEWFVIDSAIAGQTTVSQATTSLIIPYLEDGEEYEARLRMETEHGTGDWTQPVSIITQFPGVTQVSVASVTSNSITVEGQDNADNETGIEVWRRDELDPARPTGFTDYHQVDDLDPQSGTFEYTDMGLQPNHDYQYYFRPYTEHTAADSPTSDPATTDVAYSPTWTLELRRTDGEVLTIDGGDLIQSSISYQRRISAISSWNTSLPRTPVIEEWIDAEAYWWYNGMLQLRGPVHRHEEYESLAGKGVLWRLKQGGTTRRFQSIEGWKAARDYINEETPFTAVATKPSTNILEEGKDVQSPETGDELETAASLDDSRWVRDGDVLHPGKQSFTRIGTSRDRDTGLTVSASFDGAVNHEAVGIGEPSESLEFDETIDHHIPESEVGFRIRLLNTDNPHSAEYALQVNGAETVLGESSVGVDDSFWFDLVDEHGWTGGGLSPEDDVTMIVRGTDTDTDIGSTQWFDIITVYDQRAEDDLTWPTGTNSNDQAVGPEYYTAVTESWTSEDIAQNIVEASLTASIDDVSGPQRLQASNDGGETWLPSDGSETNTTSVTADFAAAGTVGSQVQGRATLGGYGSDPEATPVEGRQPQSISSWELAVTTNSLGVIDDRRYTGNHFENVKSICSDGGVGFVGRMLPDSLEIEVFAPGDVEDSITLSDDDVLDHTRVMDREGYANSQTVYGATDPDSDSGEPLESTAQSQTEIDEHGLVEAPPIQDNRLDSKADVDNRAVQGLAKRIAEREVTGRLDLLPAFGAQVTPGKAYTLSYGDFEGETLVLQNVSYDDLRKTSLNFEDDRDVATVLAALGGDLSQTKDAIR